MKNFLNLLILPLAVILMYGFMFAVEDIDSQLIVSDISNVEKISVTYNNEFQTAYHYAYENWITSMSTLEEANMEWTLTRAQLAKMIVNYTNKILNKRTLNHGTACDFDDIKTQTEDIQEYIRVACQMGIMGINIEDFDPNGIVDRAQFATVLSRALYWSIYNTETLRYAEHIQALKKNNIITDTNPNIIESKGYVMLMMMRADK